MVGIRWLPYMAVGIVLRQEETWTHRMHTHVPHSAESAKLTWPSKDNLHVLCENSL